MTEIAIQLSASALGLAGPGDAPLRLFNPSLAPDGAGFVLAFRVIGAAGERHIGLCRLDSGLAVVPGSPRLLSPALRMPSGMASDWFADPRLTLSSGRLFLHWNTGWQVPGNQQFVVELDPVSLQPVAQARALRLVTGQQPIEKNWTFFGEGLSHAVYAPDPHRLVCLAEETADALIYEEVIRHAWPDTPFQRRYGALRGGATPVLKNGQYTSIGHCVVRTALGVRYVAAAYRFAAQWPFALMALPTTILPLARPTGAGLMQAGFNPATEHVVYPTGAQDRGNDWIVAYGLNDAECRIATISEEDLAATLRPVVS
jgi:hypothetical protein